MQSSLASIGKPGRALIINLKPRNSKPNLSLYELAEVWGYSSSEWTPIMMRLRALFNDENPKQYNEKKFKRKISEIEDPIFSMTYLAGSVNNGQIIGRWTPPGASSTNSVLLWPETFEYFMAEANKRMTAVK